MSQSTGHHGLIADVPVFKTSTSHSRSCNGKVADLFPDRIEILSKRCFCRNHNADDAARAIRDKEYTSGHGEMTPRRAVLQSMNGSLLTYMADDNMALYRQDSLGLGDRLELRHG